MRRTIFYLSVALLAFGISSFVVYKFVKSKSELRANYTNETNKNVELAEAANIGFDELLKAKDGDSITVQGFVDEKFLCHDVTDSQPNICTTVLIGSSMENKSLVIRLNVCSEKIKSNCIVWKPDNLCADNILCSERVIIYDNNSNTAILSEYSNEEKLTIRNVNDKLKVTGKVSIIEGKPHLSNPIEKLQAIERK